MTFRLPTLLHDPKMSVNAARKLLSDLPSPEAVAREADAYTSQVVAMRLLGKLDDEQAGDLMLLLGHVMDNPGAPDRE